MWTALENCIRKLPEVHKHTSVMVCLQQEKIVRVIFQSNCKLFHYELPVGPLLTGITVWIFPSLSTALSCVSITKLYHPSLKKQTTLLVVSNLTIHENLVCSPLLQSVVQGFQFHKVKASLLPADKTVIANFHHSWQLDTHFVCMHINIYILKKYNNSLISWLPEERKSQTRIAAMEIIIPTILCYLNIWWKQDKWQQRLKLNHEAITLPSSSLVCLVFSVKSSCFIQEVH